LLILGAGALKLAEGIPVGRPALEWIYYVAGAFEVLVGVLILVHRTRATGLAVGLALFAGLSMGTLLQLALFKPAMCGCMGRIQLSRGTALVVQGLLTMLLAICLLASRVRERAATESGGHASLPSPE